MTCLPDEHLFAVIYTRPLRRWFRKTLELRCWHCEFRQVER